MNSRERDAIKRAVDLAGGQSALAKGIGGDVRQGHVWGWLNDRFPVTLEHCPAIEQLTGVRCEDLRTDVTWVRDEAGRITGYTVPVTATAASAA